MYHSLRAAFLTRHNQPPVLGAVDDFLDAILQLIHALALVVVVHVFVLLVMGGKSGKVCESSFDSIIRQ